MRSRNPICKTPHLLDGHWPINRRYHDEAVADLAPSSVAMQETTRCHTQSGERESQREVKKERSKKKSKAMFISAFYEENVRCFVLNDEIVLFGYFHIKPILTGFVS